MDDNNMRRVSRILMSPSPPTPPLVSFIATLAIATLIFLCLYVFSAIVSVAILLALYITSVFLCKFTRDNRELNAELRERTSFYAQIPPNNQRVVRIFNKLFWVVEEKRGKQRKLLIGSVVCFGSQEMASSSSSECAICFEDFKEGEECLVFSVCGHIFHCDCIHRWVEKKPNCPICRHCVPSAATMITKSRSIELLANLV
ncbi:putative RING-H2 finger protein ATL19 [Abrus precatorius]|uniref:RING-H2 finger protein ATL19 n=1 Tax=Abrus precatorius TaxID=3816 RepID=A0A8B8LIW3_ABRPR|nr:putative RING-H2 finger protein ATL19 [Abrus precatorius]